MSRHSFASLKSLSACLAVAMCAVAAFAQSPVAYVYVAGRNASGPAPITAYVADSSGRLKPMKGSPFVQTTGAMGGTNGSHFITASLDLDGTHPVLHVYNVASNGVIGSEVSNQDMSQSCGSNLSEFDHTGQFVYVRQVLNCDGYDQPQG